MGGCCSCNEDPKRVDRAERDARNPMPPYADWADLLKADWGTDPTAVSRDYARMRILVASPQGPRTSTRLEDVSLHADAAAARARMKQRNDDLREVTVAVSRMVEPEGSEMPERIAREWDAALNDTDPDNAASPDISTGLTRLLSDRLGFYRDRNDFTDDAKARSPTFNLLLLMAQGTVFYPGQRIAHLIWLPWARHLKDVGWTVYVTDDDVAPLSGAAAQTYYGDFPGGTGASPAGHNNNSLAGAHSRQESPGHRRSEDERQTLLGERHNTDTHPHRLNASGSVDRPTSTSYGSVDEPSTPPPPKRQNSFLRRRGMSTVSVVHSFALRNYIDKEEKHQTPAFMVKWAVVISLKKGTGEFVGATLEQPEVLCERPGKKRKLQQLRRQQLADVVFNAFGSQIIDVDRLDA
jgi:hypothetical protein